MTVPEFKIGDLVEVRRDGKVVEKGTVDQEDNLHAPTYKDIGVTLLWPENSTGARVVREDIDLEHVVQPKA